MDSHCECFEMKNTFNQIFVIPSCFYCILPQTEAGQSRVSQEEKGRARICSRVCLSLSSSSFQTSPLPPFYCTKPRLPINNTISYFPTLISLQPNTYPYPSIYVLYTRNTPLVLTVAVVITFFHLSQFKFYRKQPSPKKEIAKNRKKLPIISSKTLSSCLPHCPIVRMFHMEPKSEGG